MIAPAPLPIHVAEPDDYALPSEAASIIAGILLDEADAEDAADGEGGR